MQGFQALLVGVVPTEQRDLVGFAQTEAKREESLGKEGGSSSKRALLRTW